MRLHGKLAALYKPLLLDLFLQSFTIIGFFSVFFVLSQFHLLSANILNFFESVTVLLVNHFLFLDMEISLLDL